MNVKAEGIAVGAMAGGMVALGTLDAYLTTKFVAHGGGYELNPLMRALLEHSVTEFWLLKIFGSAIAAFILVRLYQRLPRVATTAFILCILAMLSICVWNIAMIL